MFNKEDLQKSKPFIFSKKSNYKSKTLLLKKTENTLGITAYIPPANQEWSNSIYGYNNVVIKNISIAQKTLTRLIKSYFNIYFTKTFLHAKKISTRFRRLSANRIFTSKAELKHTSGKVIITLYVYNEQRRILINKIRRMEMILFPSSTLTSKKSNMKKVSHFSIKKRLSLMKSDNIPFFFDLLNEIKKHVTNKITLEENLFRDNITKDFKSETKDVNTLECNLTKLVERKNPYVQGSYYFERYLDIYKKQLISLFLEKEITIISYYKTLLNLNKIKFQDPYISRLSFFISKIYNKKVEFNIINLRAIYLNSDILTQAMALKLRNRKNRLLRVLKSFLYMVEFPKVNFLTNRSKRYLNTKIKEL